MILRRDFKLNLNCPLSSCRLKFPALVKHHWLPASLTVNHRLCDQILRIIKTVWSQAYQLIAGKHVSGGLRRLELLHRSFDMFAGEVQRRGLLQERRAAPLGDVQGAGALVQRHALVRDGFWPRRFTLTTLHPL